MQEYEQEISVLSSELAAARDQTGVYLSSNKYQGLIDQVNRQKIAIDNEKVQWVLAWLAWQAKHDEVINISNVGGCQSTRVDVEKENS